MQSTPSNDIFPSHVSQFGEFENLPDYEPLPANTLLLSPNQASEAFAISHRVAEPQKRWSVYINALALAGFEQWLQSRTGQDIHMDRTQCSILEPTYAHAATAVHNLKANEFRLCLVAIPTCPDDIIALPKSVLGQADFYIVIAVYEAQNQVSIQGWIQDTHLQHQRHLEPLETNRDHTYAVPTSWFATNLDQLLLMLSCTQPAKTSSPPIVSSLQQILVEPATSVRRWIQRRVDTFIQDLEWCLLPTWQVAGALRGETGLLPGDESVSAIVEADAFLAILKTLARQGLTLTAETRAAYRNIHLGTLPLSLCVLTAPSENPGQTPEWSLTVILKSQIGEYLPSGLCLQISDQSALLVEQQTQPDVSVGSLFSRVVGERHEQFIVKISYVDGTALTLPPFEFGEA
jgi:hypothetical protein